MIVTTLSITLYSFRLNKPVLLERNYVRKKHLRLALPGVFYPISKRAPRKNHKAAPHPYGSMALSILLLTSCGQLALMTAVKKRP